MGVLDVPSPSRKEIARTYPSRYIPRRRELPGYKVLPTVNASVFTVSAANNTTTQIAGSVLTPMYDTSAFTYLGPPPGYFNGSYPNYLFFYSGGQPGNGYAGGSGTNYAYPNGTSTSPWALEFDIDSPDGLFEINAKGSGSQIRIIVNGQTPSIASTIIYPNDGGVYLHIITLPSPGVYRIRIEASGNFGFAGIRAVPGAAITAVPTKSVKCLVAGDSFSEPTISDNAILNNIGSGWTQQLAHLTGWDVWSAAKGGTGYINPTPGTTTILARIQDVIRNAPDVVIFAGGINDYSYGGSTAAVAAAVGAASLSCFQQVRAALPNALIVVLSPFWQQGQQNFPANLLLVDDAIKASASQVSDTIFLDLLRFPYPTPGVTTDVAVTSPGTITNAAGLNVGATSFTSATKYPTLSLVQIGNDSNAEIRKITGTSGTGPWTHNILALTRSHPAGSIIIPVGPSYVTGTGRQGTPSNDGTADRFRGPDTTHPTVAGHAHIARTVFELLSAALPA
jgi:lysophospholipase L1-like esterase